MLFGWFKRRLRKRLRKASFPDGWRDLVVRDLWQYSLLSPEERKKLEQNVNIFVAEKNWEGCRGLTVTEEMKVCIAAQMSLLTLGMREEYFDRVLSILIYPDAYVAQQQLHVGGGVVMERPSARSGEAWYRGPVILSWPDVVAGGRGPNRGCNLVAHEFAHQLDMLNGGHADGVPPLVSRAQAERWIQVCEREFRQLRRDCRRGRPAVLDCYGATSRSEFFAVATESFFQEPVSLLEAHPPLYEILSDYYGQDLADRMTRFVPA